MNTHTRRPGLGGIGRGVTAAAVGLALTLGLALSGTPASASASASATTTAPATCSQVSAGDSDGLEVAYWKQVEDGPLCEAEFTTGALYTPRGPGAPLIDPVRKPVRVRVLLPADYDPAGGYEVLYLLHGGAADHLQWSSGVDLATTVRESGFGGIVVMPEGGKVGFYSDWTGHTTGNFAPLWETFHIRQLVPWVDAHLATSGRRAVAGMSMGGYGALKYAAQYPELFDAVGSFSGGTDIRRADHQAIVNQGTTAYGARFWWHGSGTDLGNYWKYLLPGNPGALERTELVFGPRSTWASFNPAQVVEDDPAVYRSYAGRLKLYTGRSEDPYEWNEAFDGALDARSVPHGYCTGPGGHDFGTWAPALEHFLRFLDGPDSAAVCPAADDWRAGP
ncbi:alpha/beta hydrolase family protein [Streptomyces sp. AC512_CC834]|uniref:alpha/beta hydrolase n=1 Tax=Streptomyces sp. AC512_CC834 TaxID=2823691 RepID=UPI001C26D0B2|nr:alpha/beta hydrolase-fold protein [Streptomyces sp. AC512_CC834]